MRIGIIGLGSIGSIYAGLLQANDENVVAYEINESIVEMVTSDGLRIERLEKNKQDELVVDIPVSTDPDDIGPVDVVFLFTKAFNTDSAIADSTQMIDSETRVVTLQNGVTNIDIINEYIPQERILGGHTHVGGNLVEPGHVRFMGVSSPGSIGGADTETAERLARKLTSAGLATKAVEDPLPYIWKKQFHNVARKPLSALTELPNGPQAEIEETREVAKQLIEESMAVARAKDIEIIPDDPVDDFFEPVPPERYHKKSSILEDVEDERRTEIEQINGAIVQYADEEGIDVPYNRCVTRMVRAKERGYRGEI